MSLSSSVLSSLRLTAGVPVVRVEPGNEALTGTQVWVLDCSGVQRRLDAKRIKPANISRFVLKMFRAVLRLIIVVIVVAIAFVVVIIVT